MISEYIYHITHRQQIQSLEETGFYVPDSLKQEGFIHCCEKSQIEGVIERFFRNETDLVCLVISTHLLASEIKNEPVSDSEETFPHVFGPINHEAVLKITFI